MFPYYLPHGHFSNWFSRTGLAIPILISLSVLFMIPTITRNVSSEKETGICELLKCAGVSGEIQWLGWMINSLVPMLFAMSLCTIFLFNRLAGKNEREYYNCEYRAIFENSDWTIVWLLLFLYVLSTIAFSFFICSVVKKRKCKT